MSRRPGIITHIVIKLSCVSLSGGSLSGVTAAHAGVVFVDSRVAACGDGTTWATAYKHLQDALTATRNSGGTITEIWVAAGTYRPDRDCAHPTGTGDRTATFNLVDGVALRGGFAGTEDPATFDLATREFEANTTVLSGDLTGNDGPDFANNGENSYHVLTANAVGATTVFDGFSVSGGNADGALPDYHGSGLYSYGNSSPRITNCILRNNSAIYSGGALYSANGDPTLTICSIRDNAGTGMWVAAGRPTLTNCTLTRNSSTGLYSGQSSLKNCIVWGNHGDLQIDGLYSTTVLYSCVQGGWSGTGNISDDPKLLADGSPRRGSPCIDAGSNSIVPVQITTDLAGGSRFADDPDTPDTGDPGDPSGAVVDMGAYEYTPVAAERVYVNAASAAEDGDGSSWATAFRFLQDGLAAAMDRPGVTEIWVAGGVHHPDRDALHPAGTGDRTSTFDPADGVAMLGGFPGQPGQEDDFSLRDLTGYVTVLSGDLAGNDGPSFMNSGENSYHVVTAHAAGPATVLDGFTITGGNANGSVPQDRGGGIYNGSDATFRNCVVTANSASFAGAGMSSYGNAILVTCTFRENSTGSSGRGGGMYNSWSNPTLVNCSFVANYAGSNGYGGGIYNYRSGSPTLTNCVFSGNSGKEGGGIYSDSSGTRTLTNCILWGNSGAQIAGTTNVTHSCVQGGWTGTGNINVDPLFVGNGDLRLQPGSPCIDAGSNAAVPEGVVTDLAGLARFRNDPATADCRWAPGTCGASLIVDMGAYEYIPGDFDRDGDVDAADATAFLECASGPAVPYAGGCIKADLDGDGDVDQSDFGIFQRSRG